MLNINGINLEFSNMGLFESDGAWIHPTVTVDSYELIYVVAGDVFLREGNDEYHLASEEMLLLEPNREHGGTAVSHGYTSFYWLHFYTDTPDAFSLPKRSKPSDGIKRQLAELMHLQGTNRTVAELTFARFLLELNHKIEFGSRRAYEITEFIRINAHRPLTVRDVANRFGYSPDHLSKILKREFGYDTKTIIVKKRIEYIESMLINTDYSIKEISQQCGFDDENKFVKFFKYHTSTTPSQFRNRYFYVHMNSK